MELGGLAFAEEKWGKAVRIYKAAEALDPDNVTGNKAGAKLKKAEASKIASAKEVVAVAEKEGASLIKANAWQQAEKVSHFLIYQSPACFTDPRYNPLLLWRSWRRRSAWTSTTAGGSRRRSVISWQGRRPGSCSSQGSSSSAPRSACSMLSAVYIHAGD